MQPTAHEAVADDLPKITPRVDEGFSPQFDPNNRDPADPHSELRHANLINNFEYGNDPKGLWVARTGHVRKAYPRDQEFLGPDGKPDPNGGLNESFTQTKRMLCRGIPCGPQVPLPSPPALVSAAAAIAAAANATVGTVAADNSEALNAGLSNGAVFSGTVLPPKFRVVRGVAFLAYQRSIADQLEFVPKHWINNPDLRRKATVSIRSCRRRPIEKSPA